MNALNFRLTEQKPQLCTMLALSSRRPWPWGYFQLLEGITTNSWVPLPWPEPHRNGGHLQLKLRRRCVTETGKFRRGRPNSTTRKRRVLEGQRHALDILGAREGAPEACHGTACSNCSPAMFKRGG